MTAPGTVDVLGTEVHDITLDEATAAVVDLARGDRPHLVVTTNVDHLMGLRRDPDRNARGMPATGVAPRGS